MTSFMTLSQQCKHEDMVPLEAPYPDVYTDAFIFFLLSSCEIIWMNVHYFPNAPRINSSSYQWRNMSARRGAKLVPIEIPTICWKKKPFPQKTRKYCLPETQASWWCHLQSTSFGSESVPSQSKLLREPKLDICICGYRFWKWRSSE